MLPLFGSAQSVQTPKNEDTLCLKKYDPKLKKDVYSFVDERPEFPRGQDSMMMFIMKNRSFAANRSSQSSVRFEFVIDVDGTILDEKIGNKEPNDYTLVDKDFIRIIGLMPKWRPGKCKNRTVPFREFIKIYLHPVGGDEK